jgi:hypothetical protein
MATTLCHVLTAYKQTNRKDEGLPRSMQWDCSSLAIRELLGSSHQALCAFQA